MANSNHIVPFLLKAEGGLTKNPKDKASACPVPDGSGYHTNKGFTWKVWAAKFGTGADSIKRFYAMSPADWGMLFKEGYWDVMLGDQIKSQKVADIVVDWVFNSGKYYPECDVQDVLNHSFGDHIAEDGNFGSGTIAAINAADPDKLFYAIVAKRLWFFDQCVAKNADDAEFLQGWKNRITNLIAFEKLG